MKKVYIKFRQGLDFMPSAVLGVFLILFKYLFQ